MNWSTLEARTNAAALRVFGSAITVNAVALQGDFCEPGDTVYLDGAAAVASQPVAVILTSDVPANPTDKTVVADGRNWTIAEAKPDGRGMTNLMLEAVL